MADTCCPCPPLKVIKATIIRHNAKKNEDSCPCNPNDDDPVNKFKTAVEQSGKDTEEFQDRVCNLQGKLAEATANIALLRSWIGEAGEVIKEVTPKTPKEFVKELKDLIVKLAQVETMSASFSQRSQQCTDLIEFLEKQSCICSLTTPSCEQIKNELEEIAAKRDSLDETIIKLQTARAAQNLNLSSATEVLDSIQGDIEGVLACTNSACPALQSRGGCSTTRTVMSTASQSKSNNSKSKSKLQQTANKAQRSDGTSCNEITCPALKSKAPARPKTPSCCCGRC